MLRFPLILLLSVILAGCVSFSKTPWQDYVQAPGTESDLCGDRILTDDLQKQQLPYYFVTTRLPDCRIGVPFALTIQRGDKLRYGRFLAQGRPKKPLDPNFLFEDSDAWWNDIAAKAVAGNGRVLVYVHGYNNSFAETTNRTAQMQRYTDFQGPVISYNWPSHQKVLRYTVDENQNEWDQPYLSRFLVRLAKLPDVKDVVLVAHSMGTRGAVKALSSLDEFNPELSDKFNTIILASSDMDKQIFEQQARDVLLTERKLTLGRRIVVFTSNEDRAVGLSKFLHGYDRLGITTCADPRERLVDKKAKCYARPTRNGTLISGITIYDSSEVSRETLGHTDFLDSPEARACFAETIVAPSRTIGRAYKVIELQKGVMECECPNCPEPERKD